MERSQEKLDFKEYFKLPLVNSEVLKGISIFTDDRRKAFDIVNHIASLFYPMIVDVINGLYPAEKLGSEFVYMNLRLVKEFVVDDVYILVVLESGETKRFLRCRGWGMLTGHGAGGYGLDPENAAEIQDQFLRYVAEKFNWALGEYKKRGTLKHRMNEFRAKTDSIKLDHDQYVLIMCDGHCFSHYVKKKYKLPFDPAFMDKMNTAAIEAAKNIQGFILAYTQSDEISFLIHRREGSPFFDYRLQKMVSLVASWVSTAFMAEVYKDIARTPASSEDISEMISEVKHLVFDGRAFNLPTDNEAFSWFLWRQNDCVRNSMQQAAQTYLPWKRLRGLRTTEQIQILKDEKGIDWDDYSPGEKYGRLIYRETVEKENEKGEKYVRTIWPVHEVSGQFGDELRKMIGNYEKTESKNESLED